MNYFSQSHLLLARTNEDRTTSRKALLINNFGETHTVNNENNFFNLVALLHQKGGKINKCQKYLVTIKFFRKKIASNFLYQ